MYNMHGHPWSRILNPQKKDKKEIEVQLSFFKKIKDKLHRIFFEEESSEDFLRQFWQSFDLFNSKKNDKIDLVKFKEKEDIILIVW